MRELEAPSLWNQPARAQQLGKERAALEQVIHNLDSLEQGLREATELLEIAEIEQDQGTAQAAGAAPVARRGDQGGG